jgi:hypothetical protein
MTRDEDPRQTATTGRRKPAKNKRTNGVGRTGARFPSAPDPEPDEPIEPEEAPEIPPLAHADDEEEAGPTGARFGPYSVRKPKRAKEFDTGSTPAIPAQGWYPDTHPGEPTPEQSAERTVQLVKPWAGELVRPYTHTGGRTRSTHNLALEALISASHHPGAGAAALTTHHRRRIVDLCARPRSVAEVAALLSVPLGVARVLLGDLATAGAVVVHPTAATTGDGAPDVDFMHRVLVGLRRL